MNCHYSIKMTDSFADLWSSSAPKTKAQTLASASSSIHTSKTTRTSKPDAFSFLATSAQHSRYGSPHSTSGNAGKRSNTNTPPVLPPSRGAPSAGVDAFSDLFSSTSSAAGTSQTMTLAEKLALEAQAKHSRVVGEGHQLKTNVGSQDSAWLGLDSLARSAPSDRSSVSGNLKAGDDWGLGDFSSFSTSTTSAAPSTMIQTPLSHPQPQPKPAKLWDLQDFTSPSSSAHSSRPSSQQKARQNSQLNPTKFKSTVLDVDITIQDDADDPSRAGSGLLDLDDGATDFNLDSSEQRKGLLGQDLDFNDTVDNRGDDDILGILSQPVEVVKAQTQTQVSFSAFLRSLDSLILFSFCLFR